MLMASALIHLAVAKEFERRTNRVSNQYDYYLGSIAPDLAKQIGISREDSHFAKNSYKVDVPNLKLFEFKYPNFSEKKRYTYKVRQREGIWTIYDYTVVNLGTE